MVERTPSRREGLGRDGRRLGRRGGKRKGSGRRFGSIGETKKVARARAAMTGDLPHELLLSWAQTGRMTYSSDKSEDRIVQLEPSDRISCARACANYYKAPYQARQAPGEQPPVVRLELDPKMLRAMAAKNPDKLEVLRDILRAVQAGGGDPSAILQAAKPAADADPDRYGRMLSETSPTAGEA